MSTSNFGENLKREREMRGVSLDEISAATRIATRFLQAIENEQWDQLPGGVFNRGFVRAVAHYLGLDEESIVAEYVLVAGEHPTTPVWTGTPPALPAKQPWIAWIVAAIVIVVLGVGGWFGVRRFAAWRAARHATTNSTSIAATPVVTTPESLDYSAPALTPISTGTANTTAGDSAAPSTATAADSAPADTSPLELTIQADKKTEVSVDADDMPVFEGTMKKGDSQTFTARDQFDISAHDAGALTLQLDGKAISPIGAAGHAGKVTLTRDNGAVTRDNVTMTRDSSKGAPGGQN